MFNLRLLDIHRKRIAVIDQYVSWRYNRRPSEATEISVTLPREAVEEALPDGMDLYAFLAPYQVVGLPGAAEQITHESKHERAQVAHYVEIYRGTQHVVTGRISKRDIKDDTITIQCHTEEIELESHVTPAQYGRKWDHWDLADVARDMLRGWHVQRVKDKTQWDAAIERVNVDTSTEPGVVMLAKSGGKYVSQGHITLRFSKADVPGFHSWDRIRWASDNVAPVRTTMQWRADGGPWSQEMEGALPDEVGVVPGSANADVIDVRINLYTEDQEAEDANGNPVGVTPYVFAVEMIARTERRIEAGDIPAAAGVLVSGLEADGASALNVLSQACEQAGWEFWVSDGKLNIAKQMGEDRTASVLLRAGTNMTVQTLSEGDDELVNVITAYGPGEGINRLQVTRRHEESIAKYGEYRGVQTFEGATTLAALIDAADAYLADHAAPVPAFRVDVHYPHGEEPEFGVGDYVRVADPRSGIITRSRIAEEQRSYSTSGLKTTLYLGLPAPNLARTVRPTPPPRPVQPPDKPVISVTPIPGGIRVVDTRAPKTKWLTTECHVSDEPGFERTSETLVENARKSRFDVLGLTPGVRYYAQLVRIDPIGNESASEVRSAVAGDIPEPTPDLTPPTKPTGLVAIPVLRGFVLTWDRHQTPPPLDRYVLQVSSRPEGGSWSAWSTVSDEIRSNYCSHEGLAPDREYRYRLRAISRAQVESDWSDTLIAGTPGKVSLAEDVVDRLARERLAEAVLDELDGLEDGLSDVSGRLDTAEGRLDNAEGRITTNETAITNLNNEIQLKASQSEVDAIESRVTDNEATLTLHAQQIAARVTQTVFDVLESRVTDNEATLTAHATAIQARVTQTVFDALENRVTTAEADIAANAEAITQRVTQAVFDALEDTVDLHTSEIQQMANQITSIVQDVSEHTTQISAVVQTADELSQTVAQVEDGLTTAQSAIQQNADQIALRLLAVDENGDPVPSAQIVIAQVDGQGRILLDASKVIVPGSIIADDIQGGTLVLTGDMEIINEDGSVKLDALGLKVDMIDGHKIGLGKDGLAMTPQVFQQPGMKLTGFMQGFWDVNNMPSIGIGDVRQMAQQLGSSMEYGLLLAQGEIRASQSVLESSLIDGSVTGPKIENETITGQKIAPGGITLYQLNEFLQIPDAGRLLVPRYSNTTPTSSVIIGGSTWKEVASWSVTKRDTNNGYLMEVCRVEFVVRQYSEQGIPSGVIPEGRILINGTVVATFPGRLWPSDGSIVYTVEYVIDFRTLSEGSHTFAIQMRDPRLVPSAGMVRIDERHVYQNEQLPIRWGRPIYTITEGPGGCYTGCEIMCEGACQVSCQSTCQEHCQIGCQVSCQATCEKTSQGGGGCLREGTPVMVWDEELQEYRQVPVEQLQPGMVIPRYDKETDSIIHGRLIEVQDAGFSNRFLRIRTDVGPHIDVTYSQPFDVLADFGDGLKWYKSQAKYLKPGMILIRPFDEPDKRLATITEVEHRIENKVQFWNPRVDFGHGFIAAGYSDLPMK